MSALNALFPELEIVVGQSSPKRRSDMLFSVLDLFAQGADQFSDEEIALFDDIIMRLASEIELATRERLAYRLAPVARAPRNVIRFLASDDEIRVARPILAESVRVDETVLAQVARSKSQAHLVAISQRQSLSESVTDILVERGNREVLLTASRNLNAKFSAAGFLRLIKRAEGHDMLAISVGSRPDLPRPLRIFFLTTASEVVRRKLIKEGRYGEDEIHEAIKVVTADVSDDGDNSSEGRGSEVQDAQRPGDIGAIRKFAEAGQLDAAVAALARRCGISIDSLRPAMARDRVEALLILAKAAELPWQSTKLLLENPVTPLVASPAELARRRSSFERMGTHTARQIIEFYGLRDKQSSTKKM